MGFNVKADLKPEPKKDGTHAIRIRVTKDRATSYYNIGLYIPAKLWNPEASFLKENWLKGDKTYPTTKEDNRVIKRDLVGLQMLGNEHPALTAPELIALYKQLKEGPIEKEQEACFLQLCRDEIARKMHLEPGSIQTYTGIYNKLSKYYTDKYHTSTLPVSRMSVMFLKDYVAYLTNDLGNVGTTVKLSLTFLKGVAETAMQAGHMEYSRNPFLQVKAPKHSFKRNALSREDMLKLATATFTRKTQAQARDLFMAQYYLHGARVSDVVELKWTDLKDRVRYEMRKTKKDKSIILTEQLLSIVNKYQPKKGEHRIYVFPFLDNAYADMDENQKMQARKDVTKRINSTLKTIARKLEMERFSSHVARHTFANEALKSADLRTIQQMLNHSSIGTTERYVSSFMEGDDDTATASIYAQ